MPRRFGLYQIGFEVLITKTGELKIKNQGIPRASSGATFTGNSLRFFGQGGCVYKLSFLDHEFVLLQFFRREQGFAIFRQTNVCFVLPCR